MIETHLSIIVYIILIHLKYSGSTAEVSDQTAILLAGGPNKPHNVLMY